MKCYAETYCKKRKNECNEFCDGYRLLRALYKMSRIPERYCYNIPLVPEGKDLGAFEALNDFMKSVEERVEKGEGLYIWSESTGNGKTSWACKILSYYFRKVWCMIAICGNNPDKGIKYRHTWNIVRINGKYYHLDATFDNTLTRNCTIGEEIRYDYFNLEDKSIFRDHEPLIAPAMKCTDGDHFYYKEKKLSFTKPEEVYKRALQMAKKGRILTFHWRGGYLTKTVLEELLDLIEKAGAEKGKKPRISLNWPQAVIRFGYVDAEIAGSSAAEEVQMEEANEGEMHSD